MYDLSIVVPLYNEEESVALLHEEIEAVFAKQPLDTKWELILVDDGSVDRTCDVAAQVAVGARIPTRVISLARNFGQSAAMQAGLDAANGDLIATIDGDLQNDPADIPMMVEHLQSEQLDLLVGRRVHRQDAFVMRKIPSWIANRLIARVTGVRIRDYGCSLKVYRTSSVRRIRLLGEMHRFIPAWMSLVTAPSRISEVDVNHRARQFGQSKYGISRTIRVILDLLAVLFFVKFRARPGHFFGVVGLATCMIGALMLGTVLFAKFGLGQDIGTRPMLLIGSFSLFSGIQMIAFGVLAEMLSRIYHAPSHAESYVASELDCSTNSSPNVVPIKTQRRRSA